MICFRFPGHCKEFVGRTFASPLYLPVRNLIKLDKKCCLISELLKIEMVDDMHMTSELLKGLKYCIFAFGRHLVVDFVCHATRSKEN